MPFSWKIAHTVLVHLQHFLIFARKPLGHRAGRRCKDRINAILIQSLYDPCQPLEIVPPLLRLQTAPRKDAERHAVDVCPFHQLQVLLENLRPVEPLIRIVVPSVYDPSKVSHYSSFHDILPVL